MHEDIIARDDVRELVREKYGVAALTVLNGHGAACCGGIGKKRSSGQVPWRRRYHRIAL